MKSLYESILTSTNAGKSKIIDRQYLLNNGWELRNDLFGGNIKGDIYFNKETEHVLRCLNYKGGDIFVIDVLTSKHYVETKIIKTIEELEIVVKWWKSGIDKDKKEEKRLLKKIEKFEDIF